MAFSSVLSEFPAALFRYTRWFFLSLVPGAHPNASLGLRRLGFLLVFPLFLALQLLHWIAFLIDEILFPEYRKTRVTQPVFIIGIPRSGTTYLHRRLAVKTGFTTVSTWEALLAPAVCERKLVGLVQALDMRLGGHLRRLILWTSSAISSGLDNIHPVRLDAPEEDYLLLLPAGACSFLLLVFPFDPWLARLTAFEWLSEKERLHLLRFHHAMLQKHIYCQPQGARLLSKNAAFAGWSESLRQHYPDAEFIICTRTPATALASQLSALKPAGSLFGTGCTGDWMYETYRLLFSYYYEALSEFMLSRSLLQAIVVDQADLRRNPRIIDDALTRRFSLRKCNRHSDDHHVSSHGQTISAHVYDSAALGINGSTFTAKTHAAYRNLLLHPARIGQSM